LLPDILQPSGFLGNEQLANLFAHRDLPSLFPDLLAHLDLVHQREVLELLITRRVAENEVVERIRSVSRFRDKVLATRRSLSASFGLKVEWPIAQPASTAVAISQRFDLLARRNLGTPVFTHETYLAGCRFRKVSSSRCSGGASPLRRPT
jgi:hypothetical protein